MFSTSALKKHKRHTRMRRKNIITPSLTLLCVILLSSAIQATAFAHRSIAPSSKKSSLTPQVSMSTLRWRGGDAAAPSKLPIAATQNSDVDAKSQKYITDALKSIQYCYKTCFAVVLADIFLTIVDDDIWSKFFDPISTLSWVDFVDIFGTLSIFVLGVGLWRISQVYLRMLSQKGRMTDANVLDMFRTMKMIWGMNYPNLTLTSISVAATLSSHSRNGPFHFMLDNISPSMLPLAVIGTLAVGNIAIRGYCNKMANREDQMDNANIDIQQKKSKSSDRFGPIRKIGYRAYRNQALCVGSFAMLANMQLLKWIVTGNSVVGRFFSISDVFTPFAITSLLFKLNKSFLRAAIVRLRDDSVVNNNDDEKINDFLGSQTEFYNKVAETLKGATIFRLLPYIAAPFIPYIIEKLRIIAPLLTDKVVGILG